MKLPDKLFYSLEELVQYGWRGVTSVDEILHAAAVGTIPLHVRVESDCFCYLRTMQQYFKKLLVFTKYLIEKKADIDTSEFREAFSFKHDYSSLFAQVPHTALLKMVFNGSQEVATNFLIEHSFEKSSVGLLEAEEYDDIAIVSFDPDEDIFYDDIFLHQNDFIVLASTVLAVELHDINERINEKEEIAKNIQNNKAPSDREEKTNMKLIAALKTIILEKTELKSQADIINFIKNDHRFKHISGIKERTIQERFSQANTELKDAGD